MNAITWWFAALFVAHLALAGVWDLLCLYSAGSNDTISVAIRESWLRYPMVCIMLGFVLVHFWFRK